MILTHKIKMDLMDPGQTPRIHAVQDDQYSRNLELTLTSDGESWMIPEDASVLIRYCKPDGTGGSYNTLPDGTSAWAAEDNVLTIALAPQVLTVAGMVTLSASVISGDRQLTTFTVCLNVKPAVCGIREDSADYVNIMTIGALEILDADAAPVASITGTMAQPVLNLGIPAGKTPEKGVDYWTEEELQQVREALSSTDKKITIDSVEGGYWNSKNVWTDAAGMYVKYTNLIPVKTGEAFLYTGRAEDNVCSAIWFDGTGNVLSYERYSVPAGVRMMTAPVNAEFVRFYSMSYASTEAVVLEVIFLPKGDDRKVTVEAKEGGYFNISGTWVDGGGGTQWTNPIQVSPEDRFYYYGYGRWDSVSILWYDVDGNIVSYGQYADEVNNRPTAVTVIPPAGAVYARFYSNNASNNVVLGVSYETENDKLKRFKSGNVLYGKKYVACGDSFTAGDFTNAEDPEEAWDDVRKMYKTYPWWIAERNGMQLVNEAICGTTMYGNGSSDAFCVSRYTQIPADADYITLCFGLNETTADLGTLESTTTDTVMGAWNVVLEYLITNHPYAKIGILIPDGWCTEDMRNALIAVAQYWGIPYLDLKGDPKVALLTGGRYSDITLCEKAASLRNAALRISDTDTHPNLKGHEYRSTVIENFLRSL